MLETQGNGASPTDEALNIPEPPMNLPQLIWQVLFRRGYKTEASIKDLYAPSLQSLSDPYNLEGMKEAVDRLIAALTANERICLYADFDLDGTPGLALLKKGLELLGFQNMEYYQPKRLSEGYGLHIHAIEDFAQREVSLIVTVDLGITAVEAVDRARELGMDVIITDHHLPKEEVPVCSAIVNPNQEGCSSNMGYLCGAGVAFYLILALRREMKDRGLLESDFNPKILLDCFAIATITDMVPLVKENRVLVKHGLLQLEKTERPGLRALLKATDLMGRKINSQDIGYRFAPKLNALSRMERELLPIDLFVVEERAKAESYVAEALQINEERVTLQKDAERLSIDATGSDVSCGFVWVYSKSFHKGVVGLVATKMAQTYSVPAFIGSVSDDGKIVGSARLPGKSGSVLDALNAASDSLVGFGGHAPAAGFHLLADKADEFKEQLQSFFAENSFSEDGELQEPRFEAVGTVEDLQGSFMSWYEGLGPFGMEFESPAVKIINARVKSVKWLNGGHLKISIESTQQKSRVDVLWFSPPKSHAVHGSQLEVGAPVEVIGEPQWNYFAGRKTLQLLGSDIQFV